MKKAQTSIEYVLSLALLLLLFLAMYMLSHEMNTREQYLASMFEGEKTAAKLSQTIDWALILGKGSNISVKTHSDPPQTLIVSHAQVISFGLNNQTIAISPIIANMSNSTGFFQSNQNLGVAFNGTNITITQLG